MDKPQERSCSICQSFFKPNPRTRHGRGYRQKVCSKPSCQQERKRRYWRRLMASRPKSLERHRKQTRLWSQARGYWKDWRKNHARYMTRDNRRRRLAAKAARRSAKQVQIRRLRVERIRRLRQMIAEAKASAKQVQFLPVIVGLVDYLDDRDCSAKQVQIGIGAPVADNKSSYHQAHEPEYSSGLSGAP